jgi:hypothetical protein
MQLSRMEAWGPEETFLATLFLSLACGAAGYFQSIAKKPHEFSFVALIASTLNYGAIGLILGMIGYEALGGKDGRPWRVIGASGAVALRLIPVKWVLDTVLPSIRSGAERSQDDDE